MCKSCRQLACDERCQIKVLMSGGLSIREIARELGRSPATISRGIARHRQAQDRGCARRSRASGVPRKRTEGWSPEQIEGRLELLARRAAAPLAEDLLRRLGAHRDFMHTLTADSGKEFAGHREISAGLEAGLCLATPCHSRERGLNEHANGLVRQYFPKGTGLTRVTAEEVRQAEDRLNRRPRKVLGCLTPFEVFHEVLPSP
ncbi:MAG: IS30 family transposase [Gammaproteobacteria bacterium]|nr:IS30 family transposase [Gammaproteobacteria bacterium]